MFSAVAVTVAFPLFRSPRYELTCVPRSGSGAAVTDWSRRIDLLDHTSATKDGSSARPASQKNGRTLLMNAPDWRNDTKVDQYLFSRGSECAMILQVCPLTTHVCVVERHSIRGTSGVVLGADESSKIVREDWTVAGSSLIVRRSLQSRYQAVHPRMTVIWYERRKKQSISGSEQSKRRFRLPVMLICTCGLPV